ncbi:CBS domain-containing protein [Jeotgalibacillus salarius]|uniref:CBS domain-containing protein n=1 Tax=Jeotgalibacillus salarius TaxID=546023 RepID=A0A4Y8LAW8_9BACL|nr:CBS domain-containing protein [Jeotgalibacillus salarius]TFD99771.1 CBS domain-containing protein [Jeotgalibacillus salarius]
MDSANSRAFLRDFNEIESYLKTKHNKGDYMSFQALLDKAAQRNDRVVKRYISDLKEIAELRNAIVHTYTNEVLAEPTPYVVNLIEEIRSELIVPPTVERFIKDVVTLHEDSSLRKVLHNMNEKAYSQFPLVDKHNLVTSLVTDSGVANWLAAHLDHDNLSIEHVQVKDLQPFDKKKKSYRFIGKEASLFEAQDRFAQAAEHGEKLVTLIITENGASNKPILGIITPWDVMDTKEKGSSTP